MATQLTEHFTLEELTRSTYAIRNGIDNTPTDAYVLANLGMLAQGLERVRAVLSMPIHVDSGFRSPAVNRGVGGSINPLSQHVIGQAGDILVFGYRPIDVCQEILDHEEYVQFDELIMEGDWTHVSFAPNPRGRVLTAHFGGGRPTYTEGLPCLAT